MYIVHFYDPNEWDIRAIGSQYDLAPAQKKYEVVQNWNDNNSNNPKLISNLCLFNYPTAKYGPLATLHHLYIPRLGGVCGKGDNSTYDFITLPNGDQISGWSWNGSKQPIMKDNKFYEVTKTFNAWSMVGVTTGGKFIMAKSSSYCTQYAMANYIKDQAYQKFKEGIKLLLLEDGGGSVGIYSTKANTLYAPKGAGRKICSVLLAERKPNAPKIKRTLYYGYSKQNGKNVLACQGDDVRLLQMIIGEVECDGLYGAGTKAQVVKVQRNLGFKGKDVDGIAGPKTLGALGLWG